MRSTICWSLFIFMDELTNMIRESLYITKLNGKIQAYYDEIDHCKEQIKELEAKLDEACKANEEDDTETQESSVYTG